MVGSSFTLLRFLFKKIIEFGAVAIILSGICIGLARILLPLTIEGIETDYLGSMLTIKKVDARWIGPDPSLSLKQIHLDHWFDQDNTDISTLGVRIAQDLLNRAISIEEITLTWHGSELWLELHQFDINNSLVVRDIVSKISFVSLARLIFHGESWHSLLFEHGSIIFDPIKIEELLSLFIDSADRALSTVGINDKSNFASEYIDILKKVRPKGQLNHLEFDLRDGDVVLHAKFSELSVNNWQGIPALKGINGEFQGDEHEGIFKIYATNATLGFTDYLHAPIKLQELFGQVRWKFWSSRVEFFSEHILAKNKDFETHTRFRFILFIDRAPFLDLHTHFLKANISSIPAYLPKPFKANRVFYWLNKAVEKGIITNGHVLVYGFLDDFPFLNNNGRFYVYCNMTLNYREGRTLRSVKGDLHFSENTLSTSGLQGIWKNIKLIGLNAKIDNVRDVSQLEINGILQCSTQDVIRFLSQTTPPDRLSKFAYKIEGNSNVAINKLIIPFDNRPITVKGNIFLVDNSISWPKDELSVEKINGEVSLVDIIIPTDHSKFKANIEINELSFVIPDTSLYVIDVNGKVSADTDGLQIKKTTATSESTIQQTESTIFDFSGSITIPQLFSIIESPAAFFENENKFSYLKNLTLRKKVLGEKHPYIFNVMDSLALYPSSDNYTMTESLYVRTLALKKEILGEKHYRTLRSMEKLAVFYFSQDNYAKAESLYAKTLALRKEVSGEKHPDTLTSMNNLANMYKFQGRYDKVEPLYVKTLALMKKVLGEKHPTTLIRMNNLANVYKSQGRYDKAEPLYVKTLALRKQVLGTKHPDTLNSMNNLASYYQIQGRHNTAKSLYIKTLALRKEVFGEKHHDTLISMNSLAVVYKFQGHYAKAESLLVKTLALRKQVMGEKHPNTLNSMGNLAAVYKSQGHYGKAESLLTKTLALMKDILGEKNADTLTNMNNLGMLYESQIQYHKAEPLYVKTLALRKEVLGEKHPDTLTSANNLVNLITSQGAYVTPQSLLVNFKTEPPLYVKTLALRKEVLGEKHPDTLTSMNNLANVYKFQGRYDKVEPLYVKTLALRKEVFGEKHHDTLNSMNNLADLYQSTGRYAKVEPLLVIVMALTNELLSEKHPDTLTRMGNLELLYRARNKLVQQTAISLKQNYAFNTLRISKTMALCKILSN